MGHLKHNYNYWKDQEDIERQGQTTRSVSSRSGSATPTPTFTTNLASDRRSSDGSLQNSAENEDGEPQELQTDLLVEDIT